LIDLYTAATPNGHKASIMLEELGVPYTVHHLDLSRGHQKTADYLRINPNGRIPTIVDRDNGDFAVFESGAILIYLAEKYGRFLPADVKGRSTVIQWLMFQMGGIGPMFGQLGFFNKFGGKDYEDKRPRDRYVAETKRLLGVLDRRLADRPWLTGEDYTIADIATFPWVNNLIGFYGAGELVTFSEFTHVARALKAFLARPAVVRGLGIPKLG
jgi:GST-like protein